MFCAVVSTYTWNLQIIYEALKNHCDQIVASAAAAAHVFFVTFFNIPKLLRITIILNCLFFCRWTFKFYWYDATAKSHHKEYTFFGTNC